MRKRITRLVVALAVLLSTTLSLTAQVPQTSTEGNEVWYFIYASPRDGAKPNAKWLTGAPDAGELTVTEFTRTDNQRWKVVAMGTGYALINKAHGTYMNTDQTWTGTVAGSLLYAATAAPTTAVKLVPSLLLVDGFNIVDVNTQVAADNTINAATMTFSFYSAGSNINKPISYNGINIHSSVKFMQEKDFLKDAINTVKTAIANSSEGYNPGQFSSESITGMSEVLEAAQAVYDDPTTTADAYISMSNDLLAVYDQFKLQVILPELSTSTVDNWYFIQGTRPANTYMTSLGAGLKVNDAPVIPNDTQLWKLVGNPSGGFALQNKVTGEYINTDVESGVEFVTQPAMPVNGLRFITSNFTTNKTFRFWIENEVGSAPALRFHAGGANNGWNLMNWTGDRNDNSSWLFMSYMEALKSNFKLTREEARAFFDTTSDGVEFGQYSSEVRNAYLAAIVAAEAKVLDDMTEQELIDGVSALKAAAVGFVVNSDVTKLQSATPLETDKWFRLVNAATHEYAKGKAMSSNGRVLDGKYTFENVDATSDAQLFRFEMNAERTAVTAIANKANNMYVGPNGAIVAAPVEGILFSVEMLDNYSFKIVPTGFSPLHAAASGVEILNWNSGAGSASAWRFMYVKEESNVVLLEQARTITVVSSDASKGSAVITGTTNSAVTTNVQKVSVTAVPNTGVFFTGWTNVAGDTISKAKTYIYSGVEAVVLKANFVDGYYKPMTRFYVAASPSIQQAERYLVSTTVKVGQTTQTIFDGVTANPNPIDASVTSGQVIGNAMLDYTSAKIELPVGTTEFTMTFVGRKSEATVENLQWTQQITFVDWNKNYDFTDAGEISAKNAETAYDTTLIHPDGFTRTLAVPANLPEGYYRMRVIYNEPVSGADSWGVSIWTNNRIRNGVGYEFEVKYGNPTGVAAVGGNQLNVRVINSVVTVEGVDSFELYSLTGQRLNNRVAQSSGVYIVKAGSKVQKVLVR